MKNIAILATNGFEESELFEPLKALKEAGHNVEIVSIEKGKIKGWKDNKWGKSIAVDTITAEAKAANYDALVIPGGVKNPDTMRTDAHALKLVKAIAKAKKPIAAICHAAWVLIEAGLVDGKTMTSYHSIKTDMKNAGAKWVNNPVVIDGQFITSRQPDDIPHFNKAILKALNM